MFDWIFWHDAIFHLEWILFFHVIHFIWLSALTALLFVSTVNLLQCAQQFLGIISCFAL